MLEPAAPGPPSVPNPTTPPPGPWRRRGCLLSTLVVVALCGAGVLRYGLDFIKNGKRPIQIGREVRGRLAPGMTLREALIQAYAAGRNEPRTSMGSPVALVWARCTSEDRSRKGESLEGALNEETRVLLFVAHRGTESLPLGSPKGGLPGTVFLGEPGASPTDSEQAVAWLTECRDVEVVFESGFFGGVHLPLKITPDGRLETIGEITAVAK